MEEANIYFDEAMALLDNLPETEENRRQRISLLVKLGVMFLLLFKFREYFKFLVRWEPIARELKNPELLGAFYARLGQCEYFIGHFDKAIQTLSKATKLQLKLQEMLKRPDTYSFFGKSAILIRATYERVLALKEDALRTMAQRLV